MALSWSAQMTTRLDAAWLLAPPVGVLAAGLALGAGPNLGFVRSVSPFAYAAAVLLGAPAFLALRRLGLLRPVPMLAAGAAVGAVSGPLAWAAVALAVGLDPWDPSYIEPGALGGLVATATLWLVGRPQLE